MVHFVGAGPGAPDLITQRGAAFLQAADCIIYAGSLVNPALLGLAKPGCAIYNSAEMTLEQVLAVMKENEAAHKTTVRLHTGDPCLYGAIREQMDRLDEKKIAYDVCPGVSSFCGAASSLHAELTLPGGSQSVIITRMAGRTGVPERESFRSLAAHHATMAVFLSTGLLSQMEKELGVKLFEKNGHKITLTQFGEEFLSYAEKTIDVLDDGIASIKRSAMGNGTIRLGLVRPLGISYVPEMAAAFIKKNPKLDIDFTFHTDVTGRLLDDMQLGKYDLLFCSKPSEEYHFTAEPVMKQRLVLITPKGHPLAKKRKRSINLAETAGFSYVCFEKNSGIRSIFDEMLKRSDITVKVAYETEEDQVIAGLVASGFGIAVVPYMDILEKMSVEIFEIESPEYERSFYMVNDNSTYMSPAVETFRNFVIENTSVLTAL